MNWLTGYKTYVAVIGLVCMGVVDIINGDQQSGITKWLQALALAGIRKAIDGPNEQPPK